MLVTAVRYVDGEPVASGTLDEMRVEPSERTELNRFVWAGLIDPTPAELDEVIAHFALHPLAAEDAHRSHQRPKAERYGEWLFVVLRTAAYLDAPETIEFGEIQLFASPHAVVVIRRGQPAALHGVRARLEADASSLRSGSVAVVHAVIDEVVDGYERCLAGLDDDVSEVELEVFADDHPTSERVVGRGYFLQRELLGLHRALHPLALAVTHLRTDSLVTSAPEWDAYFRDVDDHLARQQDQVSTLRELLGAALAAYSNQLSLRQNEDMRRISAWVAIVAVPTMIAGIYGMNFEHMPELGWAGGYPAALSVMLVSCLGLWLWFRRSGWL
ncbi:MAG: magnesium and cobalt transport protein CorA [Microthrixaceae bacterium]